MPSPTLVGTIDFAAPVPGSLHFPCLSFTLLLYLDTGIVFSRAGGFVLMCWCFPPPSLLCLAQLRLWDLLISRATTRVTLAITRCLCSFLSKEVCQSEGSFAQTPWVRNLTLCWAMFILILRAVENSVSQGSPPAFGNTRVALSRLDMVGALLVCLRAPWCCLAAQVMAKIIFLSSCLKP